MTLKLDAVSSGYGETQVLWDVSLECEDETLTVIVGPNGAGKTTTLKTINGLVRAWRGKIQFDGEDITRLAAYKRVEKGIASVPEGRRLFPNLSSEVNVMLGAYSKRARTKTKESLEFVYNFLPRLREKADTKVGRMSGGEQQMVAIGRALMSLPSLLVLDEPSFGLAPKLVNEIFEKTNELKQQGLTVLMVEQNAYRALNVADHAYVLQTGRVVKSGPPSELMNVEELRKAYFSLA